MKKSPVDKTIVTLLCSISISCFALCGRADEITFTENASHIVTDMGTIDGLHLQVETWTEWEMSDYSNSKVVVQWHTNEDITGTQELYLGLSSGPIALSREKNTLSLHFSGNRYDSDGAETIIPFQWHSSTQTFTELPAVEKDPNEEAIAIMQKLLGQRQIIKARSIAAQIGVSPNGGHTYQTERIFTLFLDAVHMEAARLYKAGKLKDAAALVHVLFAQPPACDGRKQYDEASFYLNAASFSTWGENNCFFHIAASPENIRRINDCAFFLAQDHQLHKFAILLLEQVVRLAPERSSAWLNLADLRWENHLASASATYERYIETMLASGQKKRIPTRAWQRKNQADRGNVSVN